MKSERKSAKPQNIDAVLAHASADQRVVLQKMRRTIHAAAPRAEECISYGLPAFRLHGRALVAFAAWKNHFALYPMSAVTVKRFREQLRGFELTKGTIRFTAEKPLPATLIKQLVRARVAENAARLRARE